MSNNLGRSLAFTYSSGVLTQATDDTGRSVSYGYDAAGNLTSFVDTLGQTTTYVYDLPGRADADLLSRHARPTLRHQPL